MNLHHETVIHHHASGEGKSSVNVGNGKVFDKAEREITDGSNKNGSLTPVQRKKVRNLLVYMCFLCAFSSYSMRDLSTSDNFYVAENLRGQFIGVEHRAEHSPTDASTFSDVKRIEEVYFWLQGAFLHTVFSPSTFDGMSLQEGNTLGYDTLIGSVRISQLRTTEEDCTHKVLYCSTLYLCLLLHLTIVVLVYCSWATRPKPPFPYM